MKKRRERREWAKRMRTITATEVRIIIWSKSPIFFLKKNMIAISDGILIKFQFCSDWNQ